MVFGFSLCRRYHQPTSQKTTVSHVLSLETSMKCYCLVVLWYVSVASGNPDDLNPLLLYFVEFWKRWPECVSAVRLRVAVECFVYDVMIVVEKKNIFLLSLPWSSKMLV